MEIKIMSNSSMTVAGLILAASANLTLGGSLEIDREYASELKSDAGARAVLNQGAASNLEVSAGVRFNYSYSSADGRINSDDNTVIGFGFSDAFVAVEGDVTENMHARISMQFGPDNAGTVPGGPAELEDAYVDWEVNDSFSLRVGQFTPAFSAVEKTSEYHTVGTYRSVSHEYIGTKSWTQGVEANFGGDTWGLTVGFSDGPRTGNKVFNSDIEYDFAFHSRFDIYSDSDTARFDDQTSWRGSEAGWRAGVGVMFGTFGGTNPAASSEVDNLFFTIDGAYEADGWAIRAAFYFTDIEDSATTDHSNMGFELGGSFFFSDQWEGFARWDMLILDDDAGAGQTTGEDTFNFLTFGANYYFVPESHAAKFTIEVGVSLDETADIVNMFGDTSIRALGTSGGNPSGSTGFFKENAGEDGQVMLTGTMQWLF
tara:strand:+ start:674765 stop:676048 length:1284 start_codon:yes stop_codon:yes gene_type:complete